MSFKIAVSDAAEPYNFKFFWKIKLKIHLNCSNFYNLIFKLNTVIDFTH